MMVELEIRGEKEEAKHKTHSSSRFKHACTDMKIGGCLVSGSSIQSTKELLLHLAFHMNSELCVSVNQRIMHH
ncbi:hypothetical protein EUGRSUZ_J00727 [Eucalyptus grandis]|uniref:Uncharacterized protein n=2 Tax=Eucalyptus grandis TaxID=71139 RepID=A0ACC3J4F1_EUCGR|nr:hypothetical protein EUGRSUZ_J00727 [Eucalyptus grandis]